MAVARDALRWVTDAAVATGDGVSWPETRAAGEPLADDLYAGTAGVLVALAEARLAGLTEFDNHARAAAGRLRGLARDGLEAWHAVTAGAAAGGEYGPDPGLYTGLAGTMTALDIWGQASGDLAARRAARDAAEGLARIAAVRPVSEWRDLLSGEAGVLAGLIAFGGTSAMPGASRIADRLAAEAEWIDGLPDWHARPGDRSFQPIWPAGGWSGSAAGRTGRWPCRTAFRWSILRHRSASAGATDRPARSACSSSWTPSSRDTAGPAGRTRAGWPYAAAAFPRAGIRVSGTISACAAERRAWARWHSITTRTPPTGSG